MKRGIGTLILCLSISSLFAQSPPGIRAEAPTVVPAAPNATKMTDFYAQRPNMYTGTANVSIPLYTIDFDGWKLPMSLSYNATGIRPSEEASEVGLGWALHATGVVSRSINGFDDLFQGYSGVHEGYVYNARKLTTSLGHDMYASPDVNVDPNSYYHWLAVNNPDTEPDVFSYNFFGYSGSFVLSQKVDGPIKAIKLTGDACVITYDETGQSFTVITSKGYKGTFSVHEKSTTFTSYAPAGVEAGNELFCCSALFVNIDDFRNNSGMFRVITSWYLSEIESPHGKTIEFEYDGDEGTQSLNVSLSKQFGEFQTATPLEVGDINGNGVFGDDDPFTCIQVVHENVYLTSILSEEVRIDFSMEDREDIRRNDLYADNVAGHFKPGGFLKRYTGIHIDGRPSTSSLDKVIEFTQSYFNETYHVVDPGPHHLPIYDTEDEVRFMRSRLDAVKIDDQEHRFFYEGGLLPDKTTTAIDHFGFYNGIEQQNKMLLPPKPESGHFNPITDLDHIDIVEYYVQLESRRPDLSKCKIGVLKKVEYPTGGYSLFEYELHTYLPDQSIPFREAAPGGQGSGLRVKSIEDHDVDNISATRKEYYYRSSVDILLSNSTGKVMTPLYNRYARVLGHYDNLNFVLNDIKFLYSTQTAIPGSYSAQGSLIGYGKVHEVVKGASSSYRNTYVFENPSNKIVDFNFTKGGTPNLNGQVMEIRNYNSEENLVQQTLNEDYNKILPDAVKGLSFKRSSNLTYLHYAIYYDLVGTFIAPDKVTVTTSSTSDGMDEDASGHVVLGNSASTTTHTSFNSRFFPSSQYIISSNGDIVSSEFKRPDEYNNPSTIIAHMRSSSVNLVEPIIEEVHKRNGAVVSARFNLYGLSAGNEVNLLANYEWNPSKNLPSGTTDGATVPSSYELKASFTKYDADGKLEEYTILDGVTNAFIWEDRLPIVHGVGITYTDLKAAYDSAKLMSTVSAYNDAIRKHSKTRKKQVSTFVHDPLVGIRTVTDPNGLQKTFNYDELQRLHSIQDNDGRVVQQNVFHLRERPETRIWSAPESIDFGEMTLEFFEPVFIQGYVPCGSSTRIIKIQNLGAQSMNVNQVSLPYGFDSDWKSGTIGAGAEFELLIYFNRDAVLPTGSYAGDILFDLDGIPDKTVHVSALLSERVCALSTNPTGAIFGKQSTPNVTKTLDIVNAGNEGFRIMGSEFRLNGQTYTPPLVWYYDVGSVFPTGCIVPDQAVAQSVSVNFHAPSLSGYMHDPMNAELVLKPDNGCPNIVIPLNGQWVDGATYTRRMLITPNPITKLEPSMETSVNTNITLTNDGIETLYITGITASASNKPFTLSDSGPFNIAPGATKTLSVSFHPGIYDLNDYDITYTITTTLSLNSGANAFTVTGKRKLFRAINISPSSLVFTQANTTQTIHIKNTGNSNEYISGLTFSTPNGGSYSSSPSGKWEITTPSANFVNQSLAPCSSPSSCPTLDITVRLNSGDNPPEEVIVLSYNATSSGVSDLSSGTNIKAELTRLGYPTSPIDMPAFTTSEYVENTVTLYNYGNMPFTVHSLNLDHNDADLPYFEIMSPPPQTAFTLNPYNGTPNSNAVVITVRYKPSLTDVSARSIRLTADADANELSGGSSATINGQRTELERLSFSPALNYIAAPLTFSGHPTQSGTVTNTGNTSVTIHSISIPSNLISGTNNHFELSMVLNGSGSLPLNFSNQVLDPGDFIQVNITTTQGYPGGIIKQLGISYGASSSLIDWIRLER